jgi:hypothetical protein
VPTELVRWPAIRRARPLRAGFAERAEIAADRNDYYCDDDE